MKSILNILFCTFLIPMISYAQETPDCCVENNCVKMTTAKQSVQKGYYTIANNQAQLAGNKSNFTCCKTNQVLTVNNSAPVAHKGFYAISGNKQKLADKKTQYVAIQQPVKPTKGYYTIGTNHTALPEKVASVKKTCRCICG